jgi:hypothetical protein
MTDSPIDTNSRIKRANLSLEDVVTFRQWRRAVCAFYAGIIVILSAAWGMYHAVTPGDGVQTAGAPGPVIEASRDDANRRQ